MSKCKEHKNPLIWGGTSQAERFPQALDPGSLDIDNKSTSVLVDEAFLYAAALNYYNSRNEAEGDWQPFFESLKKALEGKGITLNGELPPHQALFIAFLRLYSKCQEEINTLTKKHLDFYYQNVLRFQSRAPAPDKVHILFGLSKNKGPSLVEKDSLLKAGKDSTGKKITYSLEEDIIINKASIGKVQATIQESSTGLVHRALTANSADGSGAAPDKDKPGWPPFGRSSYPTAKPGFALASPLLWMKEGTRTIKATLNLKASDLKIPSSILEHAFEVYLSGEEAWLGPYLITPRLVKKNRGQDALEFELAIGPEEGAVSFYHPDIHQGRFETLFPVMKVIINTASRKYAYPLLSGLNINSAAIKVEVEGITDLIIENDQGTVDAAKPFMPFGNTPLKGSSCYIGSDEAFTKNLDDFTLKVEWLGVPDRNLKSYYGSSYSDETLRWLNYYLGSNAFKSTLSFRNKNGTTRSRTIDLFKPIYNHLPAAYTMHKAPHPIESYGVFHHVAVAAGRKRKNMSVAFLRKLDYVPLSGKSIASQKAKIKGALKLTLKPDKLRDGARLELLHDFLHRQYREKNTKAIAEFSASDSTVLYLPREPYTPLMKSVTLNYKASSSTTALASTDEKDYLSKDVELFHIGPLGEREVHGYLLNQLDFLTGKQMTLLPGLSNAGELFIGIKDIQPLQTLAMLVQVAEGSSNPDKPAPAVTWSVLIDDYWMALDSKYLLSDNTNGLQQSGIIKIYMPEGVATVNHLMEEGYVWVKAAVSADPDGVCLLTGIHAQAVTAVRSKDVSASYDGGALPSGTISRMQVPVSAVKTLDQPYSSVGGRGKESPEAFYTRVSERLRHKNRTVSIWDYERLVLQEFPEVYKVMCLNHTSESSSQAPGHVTLVMIPGLANVQATDRLQPRLSKALLGNIRSFIVTHAPGYVTLHTRNPGYEKVQLDFTVKFKKNYEFGYYQGQLNADIISFLSPWASSQSENIHFGGKIYKSVIMKYIEERAYVDFVTHFNLYHLADDHDSRTDVEEITAAGEGSILVSSPEHIINNYQQD